MRNKELTKEELTLIFYAINTNSHFYGQIPEEWDRRNLLRQIRLELAKQFPSIAERIRSRA